MRDDGNYTLEEQTWHYRRHDVDWIQIGGGWYDFAKNEFENVFVKDIAHSLAHINRFTGNAIGSYSVARHSINGAEYIAKEHHDPLTALYFLTHDAHECALSDIPRPVVNSLPLEAQRALREMKETIDSRVHFLLNIPWPPIPSIMSLVKRMDEVMLSTEKRDIMPYCHRDWKLQYPPMRDRFVQQSYPDRDEFDWIALYKGLMRASELQLPENIA